jgi:hypothetical protein
MIYFDMMELHDYYQEVSATVAASSASSRSNGLAESSYLHSRHEWNGMSSPMRQLLGIYLQEDAKNQKILDIKKMKLKDA